MALTPELYRRIGERLSEMHQP